MEDYKKILYLYARERLINGYNNYLKEIKYDPKTKTESI